MRRKNPSGGPFRSDGLPADPDGALRSRLHTRAQVWKKRFTPLGAGPSSEAVLVSELVEIAGLRGCDRFAKLGAHMRPTNEEPGPGQSRLGGWPDLPRDARWPEDPDGASLAFLAQVRVREVPTGVLRMGRDAMISFFYDTFGQPRGRDPGDRARFAVRIDPVSDLVRVTPPLISERGSAVALLPRLTLPAVGSLEMEHLDALDRERWAAVLDAFEDARPDHPRHQFGGHPQLLGAPIDQASPFLDAGLPFTAATRQDARAPALLRDAANWRLLLQLDSEPARSWSWGDAGRLYVTLREDLFHRGSGARAWAFLQSGSSEPGDHEGA